MADEAVSSSSLAGCSSKKPAIQKLNGNDVLLGRGPGLSQFEGNLHFRKLVDERKDEYTATQKRKEKKKIAKTIVDLVHAAGGRFVKQDDALADYDDAWYVVEEDAAMEKTKQALREHRPSAGIVSSGSTSSGQGGGSYERSADLASIAASSSSSTSYVTNYTYPANVTATAVVSDATGVIGSIPEAPLSPEGVSLEMERRIHPTEPVQSQSNWIPIAGSLLSVPENSESSTHLAGSFAMAAPPSLESTLPAQPTPTAPVSSMSPALHTVHAENSVPSMPAIVDPRLLLFRDASLDSNQQSMIAQSLLMEQFLRSQLESSGPPDDRLRQEILRGLLQSANAAAAASHQRYMAESAMYSLLRNFAAMQTANSQNDTEQESTSGVKNSRPNDAMEIDIGEGSQTATAAGDSFRRASSSSTERRPSDRSIDEELSAFLLSSLAVKDRPVITEEQEALERESLTDAEKAAVLSDIFGRRNEQDAPQRKRARVDLDRTSIDFLIRQMRVELHNVPQKKKLALTEAQMKARAEEFSDARMEQFLRCEGMNTKLAAERFVNYWEGRREVFGPEKFVQCMTLSEALRDDLVALAAGVYTVLPYLDVSGRQILFMEPRRHTREGYTSESMLRAIWYISEVAAKESTDIGSGIVNVVWFKGASLFDYDVKIFDRWAFLLSNCWPIKLIANHLCCAPTTILRIVKPIVHTFVSKEFRSRTLAHEVAENQILQVLSNYGVEKEMLPTEMGGSFFLDQSEWIADRWAAELEEIS